MPFNVTKRFVIGVFLSERLKKSVIASWKYFWWQIEMANDYLKYKVWTDEGFCARSNPKTIYSLICIKDRFVYF